MLKHIGSYLVNRLSEKSTWIALGSLGTALGWKISPQNWDTIALIFMGLTGLIGSSLPATVQEKNITPTMEPTPLSTTLEVKKP